MRSGATGVRIRGGDGFAQAGVGHEQAVGALASQGRSFPRRAWEVGLDVEDDVFGIVAVAVAPGGAIDGLQERLLAFGAEAVSVEGAIGKGEPVDGGLGVVGV
jgi:hypothetical protein